MAIYLFPIIGKALLLMEPISPARARSAEAYYEQHRDALMKLGHFT